LFCRKLEVAEKSETTVTNGNGTGAVGVSKKSDEELCQSVVRDSAKRRDVVAQLVQNSHRGYGSSQGNALLFS